MQFLVVFCLATLAVTSSAEPQCKSKLVCADNKLNELVNNQIGVELSGHYTYLYLSQIFDHHTRNYPKIAKYLKAKSDEEMTHAERFIQYQNQRGGTVAMPQVTRYSEGSCGSADTIMKAMECALELEAMVTGKLMELHTDIQHVVPDSDCAETDISNHDLRLKQPILVTYQAGGATKVHHPSLLQATNCDSIESVAYVELEELIAHEFLGHQVEDTKEIANLYQTISRLVKDTGTANLADFLFDKHLEL